MERLILFKKAKRLEQSRQDKAFHEENAKHNRQILTGRISKLFFINGIARQSSKGSIFNFNKK